MAGVIATHWISWYPSGMNERGHIVRQLARWFLLCCVAAAMVVCNMRGNDESGSKWKHGWPLTYLEQARSYGPVDPYCYPCCYCYCYGWYHEAPRWVRFGELDARVLLKFHTTVLLFNVFTALVILGCTSYAIARWFRGRTGIRPLQFSLRTLLLMPVLLAVTMACLHAATGLQRDRLKAFVTSADTIDTIVWLLATGFLWFGIGCTAYVGYVLVQRYVEF